jgi:hypothetical protein
MSTSYTGTHTHTHARASTHAQTRSHARMHTQLNALRWTSTYVLIHTNERMESDSETCNWKADTHTHETTPRDAQGHIKTCPYMVTKNIQTHTRTCRNMNAHTIYLFHILHIFWKIHVGHSECFRLQAVCSILSRYMFKFAGKVFVLTVLYSKNGNNDSGTGSINENSNKNNNNNLWSEQISVKCNISCS